MPLAGWNTGAILPYTAQQLVEEACSRAGVPPEAITGEVVYKSLDQLQLLMTSLMNRGIQLWKRQQFVLPLYQGDNQVPLPPGCNIVSTLNRRSLFRQGATNDGNVVAYFSDQGGTPSLAFDDNFATACVQTMPNGSIGVQLAQATTVNSVGILSGIGGTFALFFEYSNDGVNYTALSAEDVEWSAAGEWTWVDLIQPPPGGALYWRVRSLGDTPFAAQEIFFGNTPSEIYLGQWNLDDFSNMPNKAQGGQVVNWYQQRNISGPVLYVWPTPDSTAKYDTLVVWATQYLEGVSVLSQTLDFPPRWYDAVTASLARRLCRSLKEADFKRYDMLAQEEMMAVSLAEAEERDPAPTNYDLGLSYYTR